ncbi:hypothetical protein AB0F88_40765 [Streptosporangium sp. NPDC023963]|uniref:hypothetical protein n=1 Tax=Streptosporangium sp. NPDC023963 TaxID=3155608 RepID=UPI00342730AD
MVMPEAGGTKGVPSKGLSAALKQQAKLNSVLSDCHPKEKLKSETCRNEIKKAWEG